jgi:hypothetical protein
MPIYVRNLTDKKGDQDIYESGAVINSEAGLELCIGKQNLDKTVTSMTIYQMNDQRSGHWELYFEGDIPLVKIDLMSDKYRILYGAKWAVFAEGKDPTTRDKVTFKAKATLRDVVQSATQVMVAKGNWEGTETYNCQDFVVEFLKLMSARIGRDKFEYPSVSVALKYELRRYVMKNRPAASWA